MGIPNKKFYKDIDEIYDYYKKDPSDTENLSQMAKYHLNKLYSIKPNQWDELSKYNKDKFLYYDLRIKFLEDNNEYFTTDEIEKINKKIKPGMENLFNANNAIVQYNKMNDMMFKRYFEENTNYTIKQIDSYYKEFSEVFDYFLPKASPPSKEDFKNLNLRVYDYLMDVIQGPIEPLAYIEKYNIQKDYSDIRYDIYRVIEYILESRLKVKIDYVALAESRAITHGYTSHYDMDPYPDSYPSIPEEVMYKTDEEYQEAVNFVNDTKEYIIHRNKLRNLDEFIINTKNS